MFVKLQLPSIRASDGKAVYPLIYGDPEVSGFYY